MLRTPPQKEKFKHSTPRTRNRIFARYDSSQPVRGIAYREGVDKDHVYGVIKRWNFDDPGVSRTGRGRPRSLDERDTRRMLRCVAIDPFMSISQILRDCGFECSESTVRRHLIRNGIMHRLAATRPFLTEEHAAERLAWALEHQDKPLEYWRRVLFTDESTIDRGAGPARKWVFRPRGLKLVPFRDHV